MGLEGIIPGLPDELSMLILCRVSRDCIPTLRCVCSSWNTFSQTHYFQLLRQQVGSSEGWLYVLGEKPQEASFKAFNPHTNKWYDLPPTPGHSQDRCWQGFECVAVGSALLVMGGVVRDLQHSNATAYRPGVVCGDVKIYNALTNKWSIGASMNTPRSWFAAAVIGGYVYVAGGQGRTSFLDSAEVYDPMEDKWQPISSMICVRSSCHGINLDGQFWVIAGENMRNQYGSQPQRGSAEFYDIKSGTWQLIPDMWLDSHKVPGPISLYDGQLLSIYHNKLMLYDKITNTWSLVGYVSGGDAYGRLFACSGFACQYLDGNLYIFGGTRESWYNNTHYCKALNSVEVCNLRSQRQSKLLRWQNAANMRNTEGTVLASAVLTL